MSVHKEIKLEDEICDRLAHQGWIYEVDANTRYDRALALFPEDVAAWVQATQPKAWDIIHASHGVNAQKVLCERVRKALDGQGLMDVLREGFDMMGLRKPSTTATTLIWCCSSTASRWPRSSSRAITPRASQTRFPSTRLTDCRLCRERTPQSLS